MSVLSLHRALQALMQCWWQRLMCRKRRGLRSTRNFIITQASLSAWAGWPQWRRKPHPGDVKKFTNIGESASVTFQHRFFFFFFNLFSMLWSVVGHSLPLLVGKPPSVVLDQGGEPSSGSWLGSQHLGLPENWHHEGELQKCLPLKKIFSWAP